MDVLLILGDQLFSPAVLQYHGVEPGQVEVFLREDKELCTHYRYHKQKLTFFLCAMRDYAEELESAGYKVHYEKLLHDEYRYDEAFSYFLEQKKPQKVYHFEIQDEFFEKRIHTLLQAFDRIELPSPMFLTSREQFQNYLKASPKPFMKNFYAAQRQRLKILVDADGSPAGGHWSFDEENRLKLPKTIQPPIPGVKEFSPHAKAVTRLINDEFANHPGDAEELWLPTNRQAAHEWLDKFLKERFSEFGPYEDAMPTHSNFVFHSVLTPFLNTGLLTPAEVLKAALLHAKKHEIPLNSVEGFVRQISGWREFVRGIYQNFRDKQENTNFWQHHKKLSEHWYTGETGIAPLDFAIKKCLRFAYAHHIERLMVVGNLMLLLEVDPKAAHAWYMEMFIDSADWVMGPNVYGMALFSDGGIFATKPYICGSNYYRKMGPYAKGDWQEGVDGLYWGFIAKHRAYFEQNPRMKVILGSLDRMDKEKFRALSAAADQLRARLVQ